MSPSRLLQYEDQRARRRGIIKMNRVSSQVINKPLPPLIPGIKKPQHHQQQMKVHENQRSHYQQPVIIYTHSPKLIHTKPQNFMSLVQKLTGLVRDHNSDKGMELLQQRSQDSFRDDHNDYASSSSSSSSTCNNKNSTTTINHSSSSSSSSSSSVSDLSASGFDYHHQYTLIPQPPLSFLPNSSELFICSSAGSGYGSPYCYSRSYQEPAGLFMSSSIDDDLKNNIGTISNTSPSFVDVNIEGAGFLDYSY